MTIRGVLFDAGGVIVRTDDPSPRRRWEERLGLEPGRLADIVFENPVARQATLGLAQESEVWAEVGRELQLAPEDVVRLRDDFFSGDRVDTDLLAAVRTLRNRTRTGILSNAWLGARRSFVTPAVESAFDICIFSGEEHLRKPDAAFYRLALNRFGTAPEETVFVDDFAENVAAASRLGIKAIRFRNREQALQELGVYFPEVYSAGR